MNNMISVTIKTLDRSPTEVHKLLSWRLIIQFLDNSEFMVWKSDYNKLGRLMLLNNFLSYLYVIFMQLDHGIKGQWRSLTRIEKTHKFFFLFFFQVMKKELRKIKAKTVEKMCLIKILIWNYCSEIVFKPLPKVRHWLKILRIGLF